MWFGIFVVLWLVGGLLDGFVCWVCWIVVLVIEWFGFLMGFYMLGLGCFIINDWNVEGGYMVECCLLFIIIVLGELVLVMGFMFVGLGWIVENIVVMVMLFIGSLVMWWLYFDMIVECGVYIMLYLVDLGWLVCLVYIYIYVVLVVGIIVGVVVDEFVLVYLVGYVYEGIMLVVLGSVVLYLLGNLLFKWVIFGWLCLVYVVGLVVLGGVWLFVGELFVFVVFVLVMGVLCGMVVWEWYVCFCEMVDFEVVYNF